MASLDRLQQLEAQCLSFPGPLSAAIYVPLLKQQQPREPPSVPAHQASSRSGITRGVEGKWLGGATGVNGSSSGEPATGAAAGSSSGDAGGGGSGGGGRRSLPEGGGGGGRPLPDQQAVPQEVWTAIQKLEAFYTRMEALGPRACAPVVSLYSEVLSDPALAALMPTNALRNAALLPVSTPLAAMVDVDLSASEGLAALAADAARASELLAAAARDKAVWVLPAWETNRQLDLQVANCLADEALAGTKSTLHSLWCGAETAHAATAGAGAARRRGAEGAGVACGGGDGAGASVGAVLGSACLAASRRRAQAEAQRSGGGGGAAGGGSRHSGRRELHQRGVPGPRRRWGQQPQPLEPQLLDAHGLGRGGPARARSEEHKLARRLKETAGDGAAGRVAPNARGPEGPADDKAEREQRRQQRRYLQAEADAPLCSDALAAELLHPFDAHKFATGHGPTDFRRFLSSAAPYSVSYVEGYEPWFIAARNTSLPYDERFRGWYGDKLSQVLHVGARGTSFRVLPDVWLVHRPHAPTAAAAIFHGQRGGPAGGVDALSEVLVRRFLPRTKFQHYISHSRNLDYRQRRALVRGTYRPAVGAAFERCRAALPWWRGEVG